MTKTAQNKPLELLEKQTQLLKSIYETQVALLRQQGTASDQDKRGLKWEYVEISYRKSAVGTGAYIWIYQDGELSRLKGIEGKNKVMVALERMGRQGWELVTAMSGMGKWGPETVRLFLKRPRQK
jgi:hypothetical protein